jgi:hypothetical protein
VCWSAAGELQVEEDGDVSLPQITLRDVDSSDGHRLTVKTGGLSADYLEIVLKTNNGQLSLIGNSAMATYLVQPQPPIHNTIIQNVLTLRGILPDLRMALRSISYRPYRNFHGNDEVLITVSDLGHSGLRSQVAVMRGCNASAATAYPMNATWSYLHSVLNGTAAVLFSNISGLYSSLGDNIFPLTDALTIPIRVTSVNDAPRVVFSPIKSTIDGLEDFEDLAFVFEDSELAYFASEEALTISDADDNNAEEGTAGPYTLKMSCRFGRFDLHRLSDSTSMSTVDDENIVTSDLQIDHQVDDFLIIRSSSLSVLRDVLGHATYRPRENFNSRQWQSNITETPEHYSGADHITISLTDAGGLTDESTLFVFIVPVNDAPVLLDNISSTRFVIEDQDTEIFGLSVTDVDADEDSDGILTVVATVEQGILSLGFIEGIELMFSDSESFKKMNVLTTIGEDADRLLAGTFGNAVESHLGLSMKRITFSGSINHIDAALKSLRYRSNLNFNGKYEHNII